MIGAIVDTETLGLTAGLHDVFEIACIRFDIDTGDVLDEHSWWMPADLTSADPTALRLNGYYDREPNDDEKTPRVAVAETFARLTAGAVLIGCNPSFDDLRLELFLREEGFAPAWHYRPFCVETAVAGKLGVRPGWKSSDDLSKQLGVDPTGRHTALGDCRWAKAMYDAIYAPGGTKKPPPPNPSAPSEGRGRKGRAADPAAKKGPSPEKPPPAAEQSEEPPASHEPVEAEKPIEQEADADEKRPVRPSDGNIPDGPPTESDPLQHCELCQDEIPYDKALLSWSRWRRYLCPDDFKNVAA